MQRVYDAVARDWHGTRYKAWPRVHDFVSCQPNMSLVADLGCGNGKMLPACHAAGHFAIGCDFSVELIRICALQLRMQAQVADVTMLPYRSGVFDAALSIAVLHHISTLDRRQLLVAETIRVLRPGGQALFYAWAKEQESGRSGHVFPSQDVFVPFHQRLAAHELTTSAALGLGVEAVIETAMIEKPGSPSGEKKRSRTDNPDASSGSDLAAKFDPSKRAIVHQRYCHVYTQGELRSLIESVGGLTVVDEYYDTGNWCVLVQKS